MRIHKAVGSPAQRPCLAISLWTKTGRVRCGPRGSGVQAPSSPGVSQQFMQGRPTPTLLPSSRRPVSRGAHWCGCLACARKASRVSQRQPSTSGRKCSPGHVWVWGCSLPFFFQAAFLEPDRLLLSFSGNFRLLGSRETVAPKTGSV